MKTYYIQHDTTQQRRRRVNLFSFWLVLLFIEALSLCLTTIQPTTIFIHPRCSRLECHWIGVSDIAAVCHHAVVYNTVGKASKQTYLLIEISSLTFCVCLRLWSVKSCIAAWTHSYFRDALFYCKSVMLM